MAKLIKAQRRQKRKSKKMKSQRESAQKQKGLSFKPWEAPKMEFFQMPKLFNDDLSWEQRLRLLRAMGDQAATDFNEKYPAIQKWFLEYDAVYVLSMCAFYYMSTPEGVDPEAIGELKFYNHFLEIMQAFALCQSRSLKPTLLRDNMEKLKSEMIEIGQAMSFRHLKIPEEITTEKGFNAFRLRTQMMEETTAVRNWAYHHQMQKVVLDLAQRVKDQFLAKYKVDPVAFFTMLFVLTSERDELLNAHHSKLRTAIMKKNYKEMMSAYNNVFPENVPIEGNAVDQLWEIAHRKLDGLRSMLMMHADLKLENIYSFSLDHVLEIMGEAADPEAVKNLLDRLSYKFGELDTFNKDHIILSNPVHSRPFIHLEDGKYFSAIWSIIPHLTMDLLEDLVWDDAGLKSKYTRAKSDYLEDELERVMREAFPNARFFSGSLWKDPTSNIQYENDLLVVIDSFAIVLEAKSASVSDPARRGAPQRLAETLRELVEEPSDQAHRFIRYLEGNKKINTFNTKRGETNVVNSAAIKYYIPVGVTLSHLGTIGSNLKKLIKAGITNRRLEDLAPSMSINDLESVLELLPLEVEKIHYLARRREFEAHIDYHGDELDLLGFYLDNGFNIGEKEYDKDLTLMMTLKSKELDPYFIGSREGKKVAKPSLSMTQWWRDILIRISEVRTEGWIETGFILLNTTKKDQEEFEREFKRLFHQVKGGKVEKEHNFVVWRSGPSRRQYVIAGYPYTTSALEERNSIMSDLVHNEFTEGMRGVVAIGVNTSPPGYPYSVLVRMVATDLFDTLTL